MKAVVAAFNQEKALVGAFSVITNLRMELFPALVTVYFSVVSVIGVTITRDISDILAAQYNKARAWEVGGE